MYFLNSDLRENLKYFLLKKYRRHSFIFLDFSKMSSSISNLNLGTKIHLSSIDSPGPYSDDYITIDLRGDRHPQNPHILVSY